MCGNLKDKSLIHNFLNYSCLLFVEKEDVFETLNLRNTLICRCDTQDSFEKERRLSKQSERQLQDIITSLREQLARPSQTETDAVNELTKLKHRHYNEVSDLKNQVCCVYCSFYRSFVIVLVVLSS